jgi:hypothetical protein
MHHIYLRHETHGTKVATSDMEADHDESFGWVRYNPDEPEADEEYAAPVNALGAKRRGRPPKQG